MKNTKGNNNNNKSSASVYVSPAKASNSSETARKREYCVLFEAKKNIYTEIDSRVQVFKQFGALKRVLMNCCHRTKINELIYRKNHSLRLIWLVFLPKFFSTLFLFVCMILRVINDLALQCI